MDPQNKSVGPIDSVAVDSRIQVFLEEHHVLSLATVSDGIPYCASLFYVYDRGQNTLIFMSNSETRHAGLLTQYPTVAGTIALETKIIGKIQGVQFCGDAIQCHDNQLLRAKKAYYEKFPYAKLIPGDFWTIQLTYLKFTDNRLGFGKKLSWSAQ